MSLISNARGRTDVKDSGYYRVFNTIPKYDLIALEIASLLSKTQSTVISNGIHLEKSLIDTRYNKNVLHKKHSVYTLADLKNLQDGHYYKMILYKDFFKCIGLPTLRKNYIECDYIVVVSGTVFIYEIKDGDSFDTKKSQAETENLQYIQKSFERTKLFSKVIVHIVLWNCDDIETNSFKCKIGKKMLLSGKTFSDMNTINKKAIDRDRTLSNWSNVKYFVQHSKDIVKLFETLKSRRD